MEESMIKIKQITDKNMDKYFEFSQIYEEEFSPFTNASKNEHGLYPVSTQIDKNHIGYFAYDNYSAIGFIVINTEKEPYDVCEFFILKEFRRQGFGEKLAFKIFNLYNANWSVKQLYYAKHANTFWNRVISKYTGDNYTQHLFEDEKWGKVYMQLFSSKK
jgi:predicted acetyltransferase